MAATRLETSNIPSLSQALGRAIELAYNDNVDIRQLAKLISHDPGLVARTIEFANSGRYGAAGRIRSIEQAVLRIGLEVVRNIIITAALKQFTDQLARDHQDILAQYWTRSLAFAAAARHLAHLTSYPNVAEAYLCGLIADIGQLVFLTNHPVEYSSIWNDSLGDTLLIETEQQRFESNHPSIVAEMATQWGLGPFVSDAIRYHHEESYRIFDAHQLTKLINLASLISDTKSRHEETVVRAIELFELDESIIQSVFASAKEEVSSLALVMGLTQRPSDTSSAMDKASAMVNTVVHVSHCGRDLWKSNSLAELFHAIARTMQLVCNLDLKLLFVAEADGRSLKAHVDYSQLHDAEPNQAKPDFLITLAPGRSAVADSFRERRCLLIDATGPVVDRQILHQCAAQVCLCVPLCQNGLAVGVMVVPLPTHISHENLTSLFQFRVLCQEICGAVAQFMLKSESSKPHDEQRQLMEQRISDTIHEASNPLSIIQNYLKALTVKLGDEKQVSNEIGMISNEIERIGAILLRLRKPAEATSDRELTDINNQIRDIALIMEQSFAVNRQTEILLMLDSAIQPLSMPAGSVKQILVNLIKNAIEAIPVNGKVIVKTNNCVVMNQRTYVEITVTDNGPGIDDSVLPNLFTPTLSTKGGKHAGLGLSITKKLVDDLRGHILCRSDGSGTEFRVLIPR